MASIPIGSHSLHLGGNGYSLGEGESEVAATFYGTFLSLPMGMVKTVVDGDCGIDVMCLMLGLKRCKQNWNILRCEMAAFALQHVGNWDFIAMMHSVGELTTHLGLF